MVVRFPWGFRVLESPVYPPGRGWLHYAATKYLMSSVRLAGLLASAMGCREWRVAGLKDACGVATQLVAVRGCRSPRARLAGRLWRARLVGSGGPLRPGLLEGNSFRVDLEGGGGCPGRLEGWIPGFYGPQRFGVERPVSHLYGMAAARGDIGFLVRLAVTRLPLEARTCPGDYEARLAGSAARGGGPRLPGVVYEAVQAYLWNRALSAALERGLAGAARLAEGSVEIPCPGGARVRAPAARLPSRRLLERPRSGWARLVARIAGEEGVEPRMLPWRAPVRPLLYPVCSLACKRVGGHVRLAFSLPPGAFATALLDWVYRVDWLASWQGCGGLEAL